MTQAQRGIRRKLKVLEYAKRCGNIAKACRYFGISRQCYYNWLHAFEREGELLDYTDDVDLRKKLVVWEEFYNVHRPHGGLGGKTPYEVLREKMAS